MNFDAETETQRLRAEDYGKVYELGACWSETIQASRAGESLSYFGELLKSFGRRLSANLVIGHASYGFSPDVRAFESVGRRLAGVSAKEVKLGAEGQRNGRRAIELAERTNSIAYILHTPSAPDLMRYADSLGVRFVVYTLCRFSGSGAQAAAGELVGIKGTGYFERRGVLREEVASSLGEYALFGTRRDVVSGIRRFIDGFGASRVVLYPVFSGHDDLLGQARALSRCLD